MSPVFGSPVSLALGAIDSPDEAVARAANELLAAALLLSLLETIAEDDTAIRVNAAVAYRRAEANARRIAEAEA